MSEERFEVIVIGGGLAGLSAAYRLSKAGRKVLVLEKAPYSGAKNVSGGRIYTYALDKLMGDAWKDAPLEREINQEYLMMMNDEDAVIIDTTTNALGNQSYSVLREKFDKWLAGTVEEAGGLVIGGACVDGLIRKDGRVCGVTVGEESLECDLVIDAEGVNALVAERAGVIDPIRLENIAVGVMIETPAAALIADLLAKEAAFFSIGTNDLTQYTMAVDRGNAKVEKLYTTLHPAVLRSIRMVIKAAKEAHIPVGMCGESAADPALIPLLLSFGLDEFSVSSSSILHTRKIISEWSQAQVNEVEQQAMQLDTPDAVEEYLHSISKQ